MPWVTAFKACGRVSVTRRATPRRSNRISGSDDMMRCRACGRCASSPKSRTNAMVARRRTSGSIEIGDEQVAEARDTVGLRPDADPPGRHQTPFRRVEQSPALEPHREVVIRRPHLEDVRGARGDRHSAGGDLDTLAIEDADHAHVVCERVRPHEVVIAGVEETQDDAGGAGDMTTARHERKLDLEVACDRAIRDAHWKPVRLTAAARFDQRPAVEQPY